MHISAACRKAASAAQPCGRARPFLIAPRRNIARMLTPAERREKKLRSMFDDTGVEELTAVYRRVPCLFVCCVRARVCREGGFRVGCGRHV